MYRSILDILGMPLHDSPYWAQKKFDYFSKRYGNPISCSLSDDTFDIQKLKEDIVSTFGASDKVEYDIEYDVRHEWDRPSIIKDSGSKFVIICTTSLDKFSISEMDMDYIYDRLENDKDFQLILYTSNSVVIEPVLEYNLYTDLMFGDFKELMENEKEKRIHLFVSYERFSFHPKIVDGCFLFSDNHVDYKCNRIGNIVKDKLATEYLLWSLDKVFRKYKCRYIRSYAELCSITTFYTTPLLDLMFKQFDEVNQELL